MMAAPSRISVISGGVSCGRITARSAISSASCAWASGEVRWACNFTALSTIPIVGNSGIRLCITSGLVIAKLEQAGRDLTPSFQHAAVDQSSDTGQIRALDEVAKFGRAVLIEQDLGLLECFFLLTFLEKPFDFVSRRSWG